MIPTTRTIAPAIPEDITMILAPFILEPCCLTDGDYRIPHMPNNTILPNPREAWVGIVSTDKIGTMICSHAAHISRRQADQDISSEAMDCNLLHQSPGTTGDINLLVTVVTANRYGSVFYQADRSPLVGFHNMPDGVLNVTFLVPSWVPF